MTANKFVLRTVGLQIYLMLALTACASSPERPPIVKIVPVPSELTEAIPEPQLAGDNNAALVDWIERLRAAVREANRRLRSISEIK